MKTDSERLHNLRSPDKFWFKILGCISLWLLLNSFMGLWGEVKAGNDPLISDDIAPAELILELQPGNDIADINARYNTEIVDVLPGLNIYRLKLPANGSELANWLLLKVDPAVTFVDFNYIKRVPEARPWIVGFDASSNPVSYRGQYVQDLIRTREAHTLSKGKGVTVAVLDTGVSAGHPMLNARLAPQGYDFVDNDNNPDDPPNGFASGHGTHVAGLVLVAAPESRILPVRVLKNDGTGDLFTLLKGIKYAVDNGAQVINLSLGTYAQTDALNQILDYAWHNNVIMVAAAGNENTDAREKVQYPAGVSKVVSVSATDAGDRKAGFSNFGGYIDLSAPGVGLYSAYLNNEYIHWSGTSMAAPLVSGGLSLIRAKFPALTNSETIDRLKAGAAPLTRLNPRYKGQLGKGRLDLFTPLLN